MAEHAAVIGIGQTNFDAKRVDVSQGRRRSGLLVVSTCQLECFSGTASATSTFMPHGIGSLLTSIRYEKR